MNITISKGSIVDIEEFINLLENVRDTMDHKEWFYLDPIEDIREMMQEGIMELWLAREGEQLVAAFDFLRPGYRRFNYGYDLGFSETDLMKVINMDSAAVHPNYRGNSLQRKLILCAEEQLREEGNYILLCTVHPDNQFSLQNVLQLGYTIQAKLEKYNSVRYFLRKDILKS